MSECAMVNFPIPIREDLTAQVKVPHDLTKEEAEKICRVVMALAVSDITPSAGSAVASVFQ